MDGEFAAFCYCGVLSWCLALAPRIEGSARPRVNRSGFSGPGFHDCVWHLTRLSDSFTRQSWESLQTRSKKQRTPRWHRQQDGLRGDRGAGELAAVGVSAVVCVVVSSALCHCSKHVGGVVASALTRRRREEMEKSASLREKLSAQQQSMDVIDRERESLKRELEHSKRDQQNTLQMMSR